MKLLSAAMIALLTSLSACAQSPSNGDQTNNAVPEYTRYQESVFRFEYASEWKLFTESERAQFKEQFDAQSRDLFISYHGKPEGYETLVPHVFGLRSADNTVSFVGVLVRIPPQAEDYINTVYSRSSEVFEWGIRQGRVKKVLSNEKAVVGGVPAVKSDLMMSNVEHHIVITFHFPDAPSYGGTILVIMRAETPAKHEKEAVRMLDSLKLEQPLGDNGSRNQ